MAVQKSKEKLKEIVKGEYAQAALEARSGGSSCCGTASSCSTQNPITSNLYKASDTDDLPADIFAASLGCGNPIVLADLNHGETVLDLGSGGGIDVLLSAKRVGQKLCKAGFEAIHLEPTRVYQMEDAQDFLAGAGLDVEAIAPQVDGKFMSAFVRARKPAADEALLSS